MWWEGKYVQYQVRFMLIPKKVLVNQQGNQLRFPEVLQVKEILEFIQENFLVKMVVNLQLWLEVVRVVGSRQEMVASGVKGAPMDWVVPQEVDFQEGIPVVFQVVYQEGIQEAFPEGIPVVVEVVTQVDIQEGFLEGIPAAVVVAFLVGIREEVDFQGVSLVDHRAMVQLVEVWVKFRLGLVA